MPTFLPYLEYLIIPLYIYNRNFARLIILSLLFIDIEILFVSVPMLSTAKLEYSPSIAQYLPTFRHSLILLSVYAQVG